MHDIVGSNCTPAHSFLVQPESTQSELHVLPVRAVDGVVELLRLGEEGSCIVKLEASYQLAVEEVRVFGRVMREGGATPCSAPDRMIG